MYDVGEQGALHACRWHSLGYWGSYITFIGASTFWIPTIVGTPNCLPPAPTHVVLWDVLYWLPQAGLCTPLGCPSQALLWHFLKNAKTVLLWG